ncbi:MAG TPA: hypothetical protein VF834_14505 [Streptosporangiaceae bacterium]
MRSHADGDSPAARPAADPLRVRRFFFGGLAAGIAAMSAVGLATVAFIVSPGGVAARSAAPPRSAITAPVRWQVLRNAITTQGTVRSARTIIVQAQAPFGTLTVTRMPVRAGDRVRPGQVIAEVDGRPVLLLRGRLPAYRDLHEGDHGPDVTQLQLALMQLGFADYDPQGYFRQSTALALLLFYRSLGYQAPIRQPRVKASAPASQPIARRQTTAAGQVPSAYLPMSEVVYVPSPSALAVTVNARVGQVVPAGGPILALATGSPSVTGTLSAHQASLVRKGMPALIVSALPRLVAAGTLSRVGSLPAAGGPQAGVFPIEVSSTGRLAQDLIGARVRLTIWAAVTSGPVLAVPVAAIHTVRAGRVGAGASRHGRAASRISAFVIRIGATGHRARVPVFTGPAASGLVAVQPVRQGALRTGDQVLIGQGR